MTQREWKEIQAERLLSGILTMYYFESYKFRGGKKSRFHGIFLKRKLKMGSNYSKTKLLLTMSTRTKCRPHKIKISSWNYVRPIKYYISSYSLRSSVHKLKWGMHSWNHLFSKYALKFQYTLRTSYLDLGTFLLAKNGKILVFYSGIQNKYWQFLC